MRDQRENKPDFRKKGQNPAQQGGVDDCRCKQVSAMTPRELIGTMWRDLVFWKKTKKKK